MGVFVDVVVIEDDGRIQEGEGDYELGVIV